MSQPPRGISNSIAGSASVGVGCICRGEDRMWSHLEDGYQTTACSRCNRTWHICPVHLSQVGGEPQRDYSRPTPPCTCKKNWMPAVSNCPKCREPRFLTPYEHTSTKICSKCNFLYHTCPLHGKSVEGPGYPLSSREQTFCQCHNNPSFLGKGWGNPFQ